MSILKQAVSVIGGPQEAANICGVSVRAVYKWLAAGSLPRTEYTGETCHAEKLANASCGKFTAEWLLDSAKPGRTTNEAA